MIFLDSVSKKYGNVQAVSELTLEVKTGEILGLIGPNGAGKTTTLKMLAGLLRPTSGKIEIDGKDISIHQEEVKQILGYIPDTPFLYDSLTAKEFLLFIGKIYKMKRDILERNMDFLFSYFEMDGWKNIRAEEYSHGMRQKVVISSCLIHEPKVIIVDEPMVGLDPQSAKLVKDIFREKRNKEGTTILMSTHTLSLAQDICDRIAIIHHGRLISLSTFEELKEKLNAGESRNLESLYLELTSKESE